MTTTLGKSGSNIRLLNDMVLKSSNSWEPNFMRKYPQVFVPVLWSENDTRYSVNATRYAMPLCKSPDVLFDRREALTEGGDLLKQLWNRPCVFTPANWRALLMAHLHGVIQKNDLKVDMHFLMFVVNCLTTSRHYVDIHGDATFANILKFNDKWRWIDPLHRPYIPGDPHVDLGKMFQSTLGYERVLSGLGPDNDEQLRRDLAKRYNLSYELGMLWCFIHVVRLLPYQDEKTRWFFEGLLQGWPT